MPYLIAVGQSQTVWAKMGGPKFLEALGTAPLNEGVADP